MTEHERCRRRLRKSYTKSIRELQQMVRDTRYWNRTHPNETPIDCEWELVSIAGLKKCLAAVNEDRWIDPEWLPKQPTK